LLVHAQDLKLDSMRARRALLRTLVAFSAAAAMLAGALWFDVRSTIANVIADVVIAAAVTVAWLAYKLSRDRRRYATEVRAAVEPLREQLSYLEAYVADHAARSADLSVPADRYDDWYDDNPNPYKFLDRDWPPVRPERLDVNSDLPPSSEGELLATFDALRSGYAGPDLTQELAELASAAAGAPQAWELFVERFNKMEALRPEPLAPGLPVDGALLRESQPQEEAYRKAAEPAREIATVLGEQRDAIEAVLDPLRTALTEGYNPTKLAQRDTPDPFPRWVIHTAIAAATGAVAAWALGYALADFGPDVTDGVLVGLAAVATGVGLTGIATHLAGQRLIREAEAPRAQLAAAATTLLDSARPDGEPKTSLTALRSARNELRAAVHQLQHIQPNPRLDTYGDLTIDLIDCLIEDPSPGPATYRRLSAALAQLSQLVSALFPAFVHGTDSREPGPAE
jgi:hypothetical protein